MLRSRCIQILKGLVSLFLRNGQLSLNIIGADDPSVYERVLCIADCAYFASSESTSCSHLGYMDGRDRERQNQIYLQEMSLVRFNVVYAICVK